MRLVFKRPPGPALNASLIDLGNRFRLLVNEVDVSRAPPLPKLPVARAVWKCRARFQDGGRGAGFSPAARTTPASATR